MDRYYDPRTGRTEVAEEEEEEEEKGQWRTRFLRHLSTMAHGCLLDRTCVITRLRLSCQPGIKVMNRYAQEISSPSESCPFRFISIEYLFKSRNRKSTGYLFNVEVIERSRN